MFTGLVTMGRNFVKKNPSCKEKIMNAKLKLGLLATAISLSLFGCNDTQQSSNQQNSTEQSIVDSLSSQLKITYEVLTNFGAQEGLECQKMGAEWASCNKLTGS